jgi:hypothetical protein
MEAHDQSITSSDTELNAGNMAYVDVLTGLYYGRATRSRQKCMGGTWWWRYVYAFAKRYSCFTDTDTLQVTHVLCLCMSQVVDTDSSGTESDSGADTEDVEWFIPNFVSLLYRYLNWCFWDRVKRKAPRPDYPLLATSRGASIIHLDTKGFGSSQWRTVNLSTRCTQNRLIHTRSLPISLTNIVP